MSTPKLQASGEVRVVYPYDSAIVDGSEEYARSMDLDCLKMSKEPTYFVIRPLSAYEWEELQAGMFARLGRAQAEGVEDAIARASFRLCFEAFNAACVRIIRPDGEELPKDRWRLLPADCRLHVGRCIQRISVGEGDEILKL